MRRLGMPKATPMPALKTPESRIATIGFIQGKIVTSL